MHPFLETSFYPNWNLFNAAHIQPDIEYALKNAQAEIESLCNLSLSELNFENIFEKYSQELEKLSRAWGLISHLESVCNSEEIRLAYNNVLPAVSDFFTNIHLNEKLWLQINAYSQTKEAKSLTGEKKRLLEKTILSFKNNGAMLSEKDKSKLKAIQSELTMLTQKFGENVLDSTNAWEKFIYNEEELVGLPENAKQMAKQAAEAKGITNAWRFTLQAPSYIPVIQYAQNEKLRKEFYEAKSKIASEGKFDNTENIRKILDLRNQKATLLGFKHFADYAIHDRMAKTGENARKFIEEFHLKIKSFFEKESSNLIAFAEKCGDLTAKTQKKLEPYSVAFYAEKMRQEQYDFNEELLRPYFPLESVVQGMFDVATRLYNISFKENKDVQVWDPSVKVFEIFDESNQFLGAFYTDWYPRESKRSGAWMNPIHLGSQQKYNPYKAHLGLICGNVTPPSKDKPALLDINEAMTLFHEFGHLLHHSLSQTKLTALGGTNVAWDFVELPSQIMENWCKYKDSLSLFAKHYQTNETLPEELLQKMLNAQKFRAASAAMRQLSFGKMDLDFHCDTEKYIYCDFNQYWNETLKDYQFPYAEKTISIAFQFLHIFSETTGYAAGYYSYKWAEMLEADCWTRFLNEGILNKETGESFKNEILRNGDSQDADILFKNFMHRNPTIDALLKRDGLFN